jgi:uncharacterized protein (TIGR00725 family)
MSVGLLPGFGRAEANRWLDIAVPTGLGEGRNVLVVRSAEVVVAIGGGHGTLSEIALALKAQTPVVGLRTWGIEGVEKVDTSADAVALALSLARPEPSPGASTGPGLD